MKLKERAYVEVNEKKRQFNGFYLLPFAISTLLNQINVKSPEIGAFAVVLSIAYFISAIWLSVVGYKIQFIKIREIDLEENLNYEEESKAFDSVKYIGVKELTKIAALIVIFTALWTFVPIALGTFLGGMASEGGFLLGLIIGGLAGLVFAIKKSIGYTYAPQLYRENEGRMSVTKSLKESIILMDGHKMELFNQVFPIYFIATVKIIGLFLLQTIVLYAIGMEDAVQIAIIGGVIITPFIVFFTMKDQVAAQIVIGEFYRVIKGETHENPYL